MIRLALICVVFAACTSDRERDCAEVKKIIDVKDPVHPPRRYWEYAAAPKGSADVFDPSPLERLRKLDYRDAEVKRAALAMASENGWTFYTPYSADANRAGEDAASRLAKLCGLTRTTVVVD